MRRNRSKPKLKDSDVVRLVAGRLGLERDEGMHCHILYALYAIKRINQTHYNGILRLGQGAVAWQRFMRDAEQRVAEAKTLREEEEAL